MFEKYKYSIDKISLDQLWGKTKLKKQEKFLRCLENLLRKFQKYEISLKDSFKELKKDLAAGSTYEP